MSVTVHVTKFVPTGKTAGALLVTLATPQLSLAVGAPRFTFEAIFVPGSFVVVTSGGQVIVGTCASRTVTVKVHWLVLPRSSVAVFVTVVVPTGNAEPLGGVLV